MTHRLLQLSTAAIALVSTVGCQGGPRDRLRALLVKEYGAAAAPRVGFVRDSTHLFLLFEGPPFRSLPDSLLASRQREVALFALAHYEVAALVDSVTVVFNEHAGIVGTSPGHAASGRFAASSLR